jgi:hypothetical protein
MLQSLRNSATVSGECPEYWLLAWAKMVTPRRVRGWRRFAVPENCVAPTARGV